MKKTILILSLILAAVICLHNDDYCSKKIFTENTESSHHQTGEEDCAILVDKEVITTEYFRMFLSSSSIRLTSNQNPIWKPPDNI